MKTIKYLSMAALALVGAMTVGCSSDDNFIEQTQQPVNSNNVVTLTATVGFDEAASNRALAIDYTNKKLTKTFAEGDQIAVIYQNTSNELVKETATIAAGDISTDGQSATFTVTMTNPKASGTLKYIYPAAMAGATDVDYTKLASQDGKLATLASKYDLATFEGSLTGASELPASATLTNQLAIVALALKNSDASSDITSSITSMTIGDGTNSYAITGNDADGHIYVAIRPISGADIEYTSTDGTKNYEKSVTNKTYAAGNIYQLGLKMAEAANTTDLSTLSADHEAVNGETLTGTLDSNVKISIADGATVTLKNVTINGINNDSYKWAGISCKDATIILKGTNTVKGFYENYPGIHVEWGETLTISGTGSLAACSNGWAAGIGAGTSTGNAGNIVINSGSITAIGGAASAGIGGSWQKKCNDITINGGTVYAAGGAGTGSYASNQGSGIGGGYYPSSTSCGTITLNGGDITAIAGGESAAAVGKGTGNSSCTAISLTTGIKQIVMKTPSSNKTLKTFTNSTALTIAGTDRTSWLDTNVDNSTVTSGMTTAGFTTAYNATEKSWTISRP